MQERNWPGITVAVLIIFVFAFVAWLGVFGPIWNAANEAKPVDWLGFAGNVLSGLMTLFAAVIAWFAVRRQIASSERVARSTHDQAMIAIENELRPLLHVLDVFWQMIVETINFQGTAEEKLSRVTWLQGTTYNIPPQTLVTDIEALSRHLAKDRERAFEPTIRYLKNFYRLLEVYSARDQRGVALRLRSQELLLMRLQLSHLKSVLSDFDPRWAAYLGEHQAAEIVRVSPAEMMRQEHQMWLEEEARRRVEG